MPFVAHKPQFYYPGMFLLELTAHIARQEVCYDVLEVFEFFSAVLSGRCYKGCICKKIETVAIFLVIFF